MNVIITDVSEKTAKKAYPPETSPSFIPVMKIIIFQ